MAVVIVVGLRAFLVQPFYIPSVSMVPALEVHDKILVSRLSYRLHPIHRGDLVVFSEPPAVARADGSDSDDKGLAGLWHSVGERLGLVPRSDELVKRVIGLPGDLVEGRADGRIYVNNHLLMEPYLPPVVLGRPTLRPFAPVRVPKGMLWVLGDNREDSNDSTYFGPIPERTVVGRVVMRVWPIDHISFL
jgi:signal peptidase I